MFLLTILGGLATSGPPDLCYALKLEGWATIPMINTFRLDMADPSTACQKIFMGGAAACNLATRIPISNDSEDGTGGGRVSGAFIGPGSFSPATASQKILLENKPAVAMGAQTLHNGDASFNTVGLCPMGAQSKVMEGS